MRPICLSHTRRLHRLLRRRGRRSLKRSPIKRQCSAWRGGDRLRTPLLIALGLVIAVGRPATAWDAMWPLPGTVRAAGQSAGATARPAEDVSSRPSPLGFDWASVFEPGKAVGVGDYTRTVRPFLDWTQICDAVRGGRRICYLETIARQAGAPPIGWRVALTQDGRSMALVIMPADANPAAGATVEFGGLARTMKPLVCDQSVCVGTFPVDGPMMSLLVREASASIRFERGGKQQAITASLRGMGAALVDLSPKPSAPREKAAATRPPETPIATAAKAASSPWGGTQ
jgi:invasion protein IalB